MNATTEPTDVVIGAGSGMGAAAAALLAGSDRRLVLADRDRAAAAAVAADLPGEVSTVACDITDDDAVAALVAHTGTLGRLIVTAGVSPNMDDGRRIVEINLIATDRLLQAFEAIVASGLRGSGLRVDGGAPHPRRSGRRCAPRRPGLTEGVGRLEAARAARPPWAGLCGVQARRRSVWSSAAPAIWGAAGARLVSVSPGVIDTPMGRLEAANEPAMADMVADSALRREGTCRGGCGGRRVPHVGSGFVRHRHRRPRRRRGDRRPTGPVALGP